MKNGTLLGLVAGSAGAGAGTYIGVVPVLQDLSSGAITGSDAGISLAIIASILGLSCAAMGTLRRCFGESS